MRILSRSDVERALTMLEAIDIVADAFAQLSNSEAVVPLRVPIHMHRHNATTLFMPAYLSRTDALAVKIVSVHNDNPAQGLPLIHAVVVVIDAATGKPLALMDGSYLTALRTGAVSGAATRVLAREDAAVAAIFGAGAQGRTQLLGVAAVRQLQRAYIYDAIPQNVDKYIQEMRGKPGVPADLRAAASPQEAVSAADIICTATTSTTPVYHGEDVRSGTHVNGVGAYTPQMQENDEVLLQRASMIVVDSYGAALAEAGDLLIAIERGVIQEADIYGELGEITGGKKPGRERPEEITFFKSVGSAVQDASIAHAILQRAEGLSLGTVLDL
ncbi:MAG: hypothetical protein WCF84_15355 [Anaerolineae bacterium]